MYTVHFMSGQWSNQEKGNRFPHEDRKYSMVSPREYTLNRLHWGEYSAGIIRHFLAEFEQSNENTKSYDIYIKQWN